jgi:hypothetical protein
MSNEKRFERLEFRQSHARSVDVMSQEVWGTHVPRLLECFREPASVPRLALSDAKGHMEAWETRPATLTRLVYCNFLLYQLDLFPSDLDDGNNLTAISTATRPSHDTPSIHHSRWTSQPSKSAPLSRLTPTISLTTPHRRQQHASS